MMQTAYALAVVFELAPTEQHQALGNRLAEPGPGARVSDRQPDKTINPGQMTSFNHYAFGAVADWLHRVLAGLAPAEPAYRRLRIEPHPLPGFDFADVAHETPYGKAAVRWDRSSDNVVVRATVPPGVTVDVLLPDGARH
jgi:alpha-L-rhamnosidase